jgi:hypothetical protein
MKHIVILSLLLFCGTTFVVNAQDKLVLRNGRSIEVNIQRSLEDRVEYTYPGEATVYERPKSAISYILYENGRKEICDESLRAAENASQRRQTTPTTSNSQTTARVAPTRSNSQTNSDGVFWQDVKTTFMTSDVDNLTRLQRVSATSNVSYKDAILKLKKKAAEIGGTMVLVMDDPDSTNGEQIEVIGIAYRDDSREVTAPASTVSRERTNTNTNTPAENASNSRRRRILQQMDGYNNDSRPEPVDNTVSQPRTERNQPAATNRNSQKEDSYNDVSSAPDAIYLLSGRVIRGTIEEFEPDDFVSIRSESGKVYEYSMDDVRRVQRGSAARTNSSSRQSANKQQNANTQRRTNSVDYEDNDDYASRNSNNNRRTSRYDEDYYDAGGSVSGYKGTFDLGYTLPIGVGEKGRFEVHTSHGYQLNDYLFVGVGVGLHIYSARDPLLKTNMGKEKYPQYVNNDKYKMDSVTYMHAVDSSFMTLPIFLDVRGYYPMGKISPFVMFRLGYSFNLTDGFGGMGLYMNPAVGIKYNMSPKLGVALSLGYSVQGYGGIPTDGGYGFYYIKDRTGLPYEAKNAGGFTLKLGVEF